MNAIIVQLLAYVTYSTRTRTKGIKFGDHKQKKAESSDGVSKTRPNGWYCCCSCVFSTVHLMHSGEHAADGFDRSWVIDTICCR